MYVCSAAISLIPLNLGDMLIQLEKAIFFIHLYIPTPHPHPPFPPFPSFPRCIHLSIHSFIFFYSYAHHFIRITVGHVGASVTQVSSLPQKTIPRSFERCGQIYSFVGILVAALNNIRCSTGFL